MKKTLLALVSIFIFNSTISLASHITGGEVSYQAVALNQYKVTLVLYWDCMGLNPGTTANMSTSNSCSFTDVNFTVNLDTAYEVSQLCPTALTTCSGGSYPGLYKNVYSGVVTLPGACNSWVFNFTDCCRSATINAPNMESSTFYAMLNSVDAPNNESPIFNSLPFPYYSVGQAVQYNPWVTGHSGDSLSYSFISAMSTDATTSVMYAMGYSGAVPVSGITINSSTGLIQFTPSTIGTFIISVLVTQRNSSGVIIGKVIRDIQMNVVNGTNQTVTSGSGAITNPTGSGIAVINNNTIQVCENMPFTFDVTFTDPDLANVLTYSSNIAQQLTGAVITPSGTNPLTLTVSWTPTSVSSSINHFSVHVTDNVCPIPGQQILQYTVIVNPAMVSPNFTMVADSTNALNYWAFNASNGSGYTYSWDFGDGSALSTVASPVHTYSTAGIYTVCLTERAGACAAITCHSLNVSGALNTCMALYNISSDASTSNPNDYIITDLSYGSNLTYLWDFGDTTTSTAQHPVHTYLGGGPYQLCLTVDNGAGCTSTFCDSLFAVDSLHSHLQPIAINIVDGPSGPGTTVGVNQVENTTEEIEIYPNPSNGIFQISDSKFQISTVKVFNIFGELIYSTSSASGRTGGASIDLSKDANGIYFVQITGSNKSIINKRIIKQ